MARSFSKPHRLHAMTELNVTPMLDLCFCLLIIFMIATPVLEQTTQINLPKAAQGAGAPPESKTRYLVVAVRAGGQLSLADKPVSLRDLEAEFSKVAALPETEQPVVRVRGEEEAVRVANDNVYGLSAAVFTRDTARGWRVAQRIDSGICHVNGPTVHDEAQMPFGGVKGSGWGRFGGRAGIDAFTELRWITMQTGPRHYPF